MGHDESTQDPGHGEAGHVHDENWNGAAELGMVLGGLPASEPGTGGAAAGPEVNDHADEETKQETGTVDDDKGVSEPSRR